MGQVRVARFTVFDFTNQSEIPSSRYARLDTIAVIGGRPVKDTEICVDESEVDEFGLTRPGFAPRPKAD
jgi:hypothetical protein